MDSIATPLQATVIRKKVLSQKRLAAYNTTQELKGVAYLSRVPPYMKPVALRKLLSGYGTEILRIYLQSEDTAVHARRVSSGGNKKKCFTEGWVEFADKRRAKRIASTLNNTPIGGGARSFYAHDLWNIKYLHKFKWTHLTDKIATEARLRQDKMRSELSQAKKETNFYKQKVGQARGIAAMSERRQRRSASQSGELLKSEVRNQPDMQPDLQPDTPGTQTSYPRQLAPAPPHEGSGITEGGKRKRRLSCAGPGMQNTVVDGDLGTKRQIHRTFKQRRAAPPRTQAIAVSEALLLPTKK